MRHERTKYLILVIALVVCAMAPGALAIPTDGLVAWWPFQGNADDASGNANDGVMHGVTLTEDRFGNPSSAYYFDGINDYIDIGTGVKPPMAMTVGAWIRVDSLQGASQQNPIFRNDYVDSGSYRYGVALYAGSHGSPAGGLIDAQIYEGFSDSSNRRNKVSTEPVVTTGSWHHIAIVFSSINDIRLYWDGSEIPGTYHGTGSGLLYSSSGHGALGMFYTNVGIDGPIYFHGAMDCVWVYDRALTEAEIREAALCGVVPVPGAAILTLLGADIVNWLRRRRVL